MGRITDKINKFLLRVANRLGIKRDNLLESAKEDLKAMDPVINNAVPRDAGIKEEILSDRDKFAKELQDHATRFDPSMMSKEEAIMKILEQQGLNPEFAKNPAAVKQISEICNKNLERNGIENITSSNLDKVKYEMTSGISISENGNLTYTDKKAEPIMKDSTYVKYHAKREEATTFSINSYKMFEKTQKFRENYSTQKSEQGSYIDYHSMVTRKKITYDKNGIEMKEEYDNAHYDLEGHSPNGTALMTDGKSYTIERNDDLITARYSVQKEPNNIYCGYGRGNVSEGYEEVSKDIYVTAEHPEELGGPRPDYESIVSANLNNEHIFGEVEYYSEVDEPKKYKEQKENHAKLIKNATSKSTAFKKTAEENGLIEKEAELEQE